MREGLLDALRQVVGPEALLNSAAERFVYECDAYTIEKHRPSAIVLPKSTEEILSVLSVCRRYNVAFTPRGAGTSLAGGAIPAAGSVLLSLSRMNQILEIDLRNRFAVVEPGVVNLWLTQRLRGTGFHYAPDPSSQGACTIGGNVATNSGGPHTLKYGVTVNHVLGVELALSDGSLVRLGGPPEDSEGYDLTGLVVGAEGTFGVCTKVWVKLSPDPQSYRTLLGVFPSVDAASHTVGAILSAGIIPAALEMMDALIVEAVEAAFHLGFPADAGAVLLIELDGFEAGLEAQALSVEAIARSCGAIEVRRAESEEARAALWKGRKRAFGAVGRLAPSYCCQDGVVPRSKLPEVMRSIAAIGQRHQLRIANVFHAGDGNLHPILLFDERAPEQIQRVLAASRDILEECLRLGGSVTGEHGIGLEKLEFMSSMFSLADLEVMGVLRAVFDPEGRANPGKLLPGAGCVEVGLRATRRAT